MSYHLLKFEKLWISPNGILLVSFDIYMACQLMQRFYQEQNMTNSSKGSKGAGSETLGRMVESERWKLLNIPSPTSGRLTPTAGGRWGVSDP